MSPTVVVVGAGNIRCAPAVLGALAGWWPEGEASVSLFDANEERLDLIDRLARRVFDDFHKDMGVRASSDLAEALEGGTAVLLCLNEDGSRRMVGGSVDELEDVSNSDAVGFRRGDGNRPTPVEQLSPMTRQLLSRPRMVGGTREEAILRAVEVFREAWGGRGAVLSLLRGVETGFESVDWPGALSAEELWMRPHQILRWLGGDEALDGLVDAGRSGPVLDWLGSI